MRGTLRHAGDVTMLDAGYKHNVIPQHASANVDCRFLPGHEDDFSPRSATSRVARVDVEVLHREFRDLDAPFRRRPGRGHDRGAAHRGPDAEVLPYCLSGGTDNKALSLLGVTGYGFAPLRLPADLDFAPMFHGIDERRTRRVAALRHASAAAAARDLLTERGKTRPCRSSARWLPTGPSATPSSAPGTGPARAARGRRTARDRHPLRDRQVVRMWPDTGLLRVEASVPDDGDADRFAQVVKDHLERFGQRGGARRGPEQLPVRKPGRRHAQARTRRARVRTDALIDRRGRMRRRNQVRVRPPK